MRLTVTHNVTRQRLSAMVLARHGIRGSCAEDNFLDHRKATFLAQPRKTCHDTPARRAEYHWRGYRLAGNRFRAFIRYHRLGAFFREEEAAWAYVCATDLLSMRPIAGIIQPAEAEALLGKARLDTIRGEVVGRLKG